jgi:tetratricopeptide (TPR) repeat protein
MADGQFDAAVGHFEQAVATQDELPYTEPPFWYYPTRHSLGKALLAAGKAAEAETVYRRDLEVYPHNGWAMFGLVQALEAQDKDAAEVQAMFDHTWSQADVTLTASRF